MAEAGTRTCHTCKESNPEPQCEACAASQVSRRAGNHDFPQVPENGYRVDIAIEYGPEDFRKEDTLEYFLYAEDHTRAAAYAGESLTGDYYWAKRRAKPLAAKVTRESDGTVREFRAAYEGRTYEWEGC